MISNTSLQSFSVPRRATPGGGTAGTASLQGAAATAGRAATGGQAAAAPAIGAIDRPVSASATRGTVLDRWA